MIGGFFSQAGLGERRVGSGKKWVIGIGVVGGGIVSVHVFLNDLNWRVIVGLGLMVNE